MLRLECVADGNLRKLKPENYPAEEVCNDLPEEIIQSSKSH